ncbi:MAG: LCP family protein, partial [Nocardioidaceae bacterium]
MTLEPSRAGVSARERADSDSARIRFRRAVGLVLMTLLLPGSAQLVAGNRRIGRIALWTSLTVFGAAAVIAVLTWSDRGIGLSLLTNTELLYTLRGVLVVLAVGWAALFVNAWLLGYPPALRRGHRLAMVGVSSSLCILTAGSLLAGAHIVAVQRDFITHVFGSTAISEPEYGRYNVLLLGGDSGADRVGLRPDSLTVASIDEETGRTVLVSLPRNLEHAPFPEGSTMDERFPNGFHADGGYLNSINTWATDHDRLFDGVDNPGIEATKQAVEETTGLKINYYAMVNMEGFRDLVDAVGGLTLDVPERLPIGGVGGPVTGYIEPGKQELDGFHSLWFARSRATSDDYSRMARQKCVMSAMLDQLSPRRVLTNVSDIADSGKRLLSTDIPGKQLDTFLDLALMARSQK